jgi:hypothetical protein
MKRVALNILFFVLPLVLLIWLVPVDRRQRFIQLKEDCSWHGIWFFDRVHHNKTPVDVAFLGSSHTINGIMDEAVEKQLGDGSLHVVNFGYCRYGVNIYPVLLKEILLTKKPKILFLEVREDENRYSHPVFPYIADARDIFLATPFFNRDLARDYFNAFLYRIRLLKAQYFHKDSLAPFREGDFGYMGSKDTASKAFLEKVRLERMKPKVRPGRLERDFYMTYPRIYLRKLSALCVENDVQLCFLYLPEYGSPEKEPAEMMTYRKYGTVLIPPHEIFEDPANWGDESHLNTAGAGKLSAWVAAGISKAFYPHSPSIP